MEEESTNTTQPKKASFFIDLLQSVAIAISISIFLFVFIVTPNQVDGPSMIPNFITGDLLFTSKIHKWIGHTSLGKTLDLEYKRGEIVVFQKPGFVDFVKRVIALPGEEISLKDGIYFINGERLNEFYTVENDLRKDGVFLKDGGEPLVLGNDEYFLSGDNRDVSFDSRSLGPIKREWIKGKVVFRFWPLQKFGIVEAGKFQLGE